ncbi:MAG: polysaccharide deacetylase family protein [Pseudomonadota bacterium]
MNSVSNSDLPEQTPLLPPAMSAMRSWRMPMLLRLSAAIHVAMLLAAVVFDVWLWALAVLAINHLVITVVGLLPRSTWLGANCTRLPASAVLRREIALTIDDGPDPVVTPQVLDLLDHHGIKATFFCIADKAAMHPTLCKSIVERGHTVENHSQRHRHWFSLLGYAGMRREISDAQKTLMRITGREPRFFRAPAGLRNPFLDPVLSQLGLRLVAWSRRGYDTRTGNSAVVCQRLLRGLQPGAILLVHDGNCALSGTGAPVVLDVLPKLFAAARQNDLRFVTLPDALPSQ